MRAKIGIAVLLAAGFIAGAAVADEQKPLRIDRIKVQLMYERSGTLSVDIAPPSKFSTWNTVIGEGDAKEPANDLLVTLVLTGGGAEALNVDAPVTLSVKNAKGAVLAKRTFRNVFIQQGKNFRSLQVPDVACAGALTIEASTGALRKTTKVEMNCGE